MNKALFSSSSAEWETPWELYEQLDDEFNFVLDPCATKENAKCNHYFTEEMNGLSRSWVGYHAAFVNPPYGRAVGKWVKYSFEQARHGMTVVMLIPARTDTKYWHEYVMRAREVRLIRGRIKFILPDGSTGPAPFPSAIVVFDTYDRSEGPRFSSFFINEGRKLREEWEIA